MSRCFVFAYNPAMAKTLAELTADMHAFVAAKGWYAPESPRPQTPRNIATSLAIEAAEVLRLLPVGRARTRRGAGRRARRCGALSHPARQRHRGQPRRGDRGQAEVNYGRSW